MPCASNNYVVGSKAVTTFGNGTAPTRSCEILNSALHCVDIADQSVDPMDLGVVCKTHQDVISSVIKRTIEEALQTCPEPTTITLADEVQSCGNTGSPTAALGGVIGLLVVVLLGLAIGLTVTCCVLGKRRSQKQQAE